MSLKQLTKRLSQIEKQLSSDVDQDFLHHVCLKLVAQEATAEELAIATDPDNPNAQSMCDEFSRRIKARMVSIDLSKVDPDWLRREQVFYSQWAALPDEELAELSARYRHIIGPLDGVAREG